MGWVESPLYFTVLIEMACDLANQHLRTALRQAGTQHGTPTRDGGNNTASEGRETQAARRMEYQAPQGSPVAAVDVYVDDFLLMAQTESQRREVMRTSLHAINAVFEPLFPHNPPHRKEPA